MDYNEIRSILMRYDLKVTTQRIAVFEAVTQLKNHPTADKIIDFIRVNYPSVAIGTVYKTLETFVDKGIIRRVKTERDVMHYDAILDNHHHLYCSDSDKIEDYFDEELDNLLEQYFDKKGIPGFEIDEIKLNINGKFKNKNQN